MLWNLGNVSHSYHLCQYLIARTSLVNHGLYWDVWHTGQIVLPQCTILMSYQWWQQQAIISGAYCTDRWRGVQWSLRKHGVGQAGRTARASWRQERVRCVHWRRGEYYQEQNRCMSVCVRARQRLRKIDRDEEEEEEWGVENITR